MLLSERWVRLKVLLLVPVVSAGEHGCWLCAWG